MLGSVPDDGTVIVADLEAGIGTLTRLAEGAVDATIVVVEPTPRSINVAERAVAVANEKRQGRLIIVANKIADDDDKAFVQTTFSGNEILFIPEDPTIEKADREGRSPIDVDPESPAVVVIRELADLLLPAVAS